MKRILSFMVIFWGGFLSSQVFAAATFTDAAGSLEEPLVLINKLMYVAAYIVGAILFFMGISQYKIHKKTPKLVPLTTPIFIWVLSLVCLLLPFFAKFMDKDGASPEKRENKKEASAIFKRPASSSDPRLVVPKRNQNPPPPSSNPKSRNNPNRTYDSPHNKPAEPIKEENRHWSDDF